MKLLFLSILISIIFLNPMKTIWANPTTNLELEFEAYSSCTYLNSCGKLLTNDGIRSVKITEALLSAPGPQKEGLLSFFKNLNDRINSLEEILLTRKNISKTIRSTNYFKSKNVYNSPIFMRNEFIRHELKLSKEIQAAFTKAKVESSAIANVIMLEDSLPFSEYLKSHPLKNFLQEHLQATQKAMFVKLWNLDPLLLAEVNKIFLAKSPAFYDRLINDIKISSGRPRGNNQMKGSLSLGAMGLTGGLAMIALPGIADYYQKSEVAEDCQKQFNLNHEELDYLKEHITVLEIMGAEGCQLAFTPIHFYSILKSENKLSPGFKKMMVAKTLELKARTNIDLKYESSKNNVCESAEIYDGTKKLATVMSSENGPLKISIVENNIAYQVGLKKIPELTFMNFSLECLKANGQKDGVCTANLQSYLGSFGRGGTSATVNGPDYFVNHFKDPIAFNELCLKNINRLNKDKKVACDYLSRVERLQVALAGLDVLCGATKTRANN